MSTRPAKTLTPVMRQYLAAKEQYPDALLFFRLGDFYELFFDDALLASKALDLKLTTRERNDPDPTPMCGVPHHAAQLYLAKLLELGHNVALCEQVEDPAKTKGIVRRSVVRVFTPALVLDGEALSPRSNQFLAAVAPPEEPGAVGPYGLAAFDLSTGELFVSELRDLAALAGELGRLEVRELLAPAMLEESLRTLTRMLPRLFLRVAEVPSAREATERLLSALGPERARDEAEGLTMPCRRAAGLALSYAHARSPGFAIAVHRLLRLDVREHLVLDETAQQHLELFVTARGERKGSLIHHLDATVTPMGARRLRNWLAFPLTDVRRIKKRHDAVELLCADQTARTELRRLLAEVPDLERIAVRATLGAATPRDLGSLRDGLARLPALISLLDSLGGALKALKLTDELAPLRALLTSALADSPPASLDEGGLLRAGFDPAHDKVAALTSGGRDELAAMELRERERTKIGSLKVSYNRVFGYFIEVTKANLKNVPADFKRKQTVATGERFVTEELAELERRIVEAEDKLRALEQEHFARLCAETGARVAQLSRTATTLADLDALASFAELAHRHDYARPEVDDGLALSLTDARHPVVELAMDPGSFVPNDVQLDAKGERLLLVTGPNMAGKSTLMRQVALCVLLAQAGGFVPARAARMGVVDRIFTRVGASDDLTGGRSTFMVEMTETSAILRGATARSLVVFDEIGRGTSTYDGLAIAWSVAEYLHDTVRCRALFATHYHELCLLADSKPHAANVNVSARENGETIVFLHKLQRGGASRSYGLAVARLAGLPEAVVARARVLLKDLERGEGPGHVARQQSLFEPRADAPEHPALAALKAVDPERLSPLEALNFLAQLRTLATAAPKG